jgi:CRISPR-associated protein Csd2
MAASKKSGLARKASPLEVQVQALEKIAGLFQGEADALHKRGANKNKTSVGAAAAADAIVPTTDEDADSTSDDVAESLEWVTDDWKTSLNDFLDREIKKGAGDQFFSLYEVHNYNHAAELLATSYKSEFLELVNALLTYRIRTDWIVKSGGNESPIPQRLQQILYPLGWHETRLKGHLVFESHVAQKTAKIKKNGEPQLKQSGFPAYETAVHVVPTLRQLVVDAHKIDHVKGQVAFDMEWNSKDQTFDRDLYAMRLFHEAHLIGAGVLLTRSKDLNPVFQKLQESYPKLAAKYGASTTWMGKLLYRLRSSRSGGCPVLALGMKRTCIEDWPARDKPKAP